MRFPRSQNRALRSSVAILTGWLWLSSLEGCTDPAFRDLPTCDGAPCDDAGGPRDGGFDAFDADAETEDSIDTRPDASSLWGAGLVGQYGIRIRFYSLSSADTSRFDHEIILLAQITQDRGTGRVNMTTQRCKDAGYTISKSLVGARQDFSWPGAAELPEEHFELVLEGGEFHTVANPRAIGYVDKQPEECVAGSTLRARADQVWQQNCTCRNDPLPMLIDDCRVTDADRDGNPGVSSTQAGIVKGTNFVRVQDRCRIINGTIAKDGRHAANYVEDYDYKQMQCAGSSDCSQIPVTGCPPDLNPVEFEPLDQLPDPTGGDWDCDSLVAGSTSGALFSSDALRFPEVCDPPK